MGAERKAAIQGVQGKKAQQSRRGLGRTPIVIRRMQEEWAATLVDRDQGSSLLKSDWGKKRLRLGAFERDPPVLISVQTGGKRRWRIGAPEREKTQPIPMQMLSY